MSEDYDKIGRKIKTSSETTIGNRTDIEATFDDGSKAEFVEVRHTSSFAGSGRPRWVDYVTNHQINTTITDDAKKNDEQ